MRLLCNLIVQPISNIASLFPMGCRQRQVHWTFSMIRYFSFKMDHIFSSIFGVEGSGVTKLFSLIVGKRFIYPNTFVNDSKCMDWCSPRVKTLYDNSMDLERLKTVPGLDAYESRQFCSNWETWWSHLISYYQQFCPPKFQQIQKYWWPVLNQICFFHSDSRDRQREHEDLKTLNG